MKTDAEDVVRPGFLEIPSLLEASAHTPFQLNLDFGDLNATYNIRNVSSTLYNLGFVLEFSKDFGKSRKPWWGGKGVWAVGG